MKTKPTPLKPIEEAVSDYDPDSSDPNHALVIYQRHYKGRETEVTFEQFLNAIPAQPEEKEPAE